MTAIGKRQTLLGFVALFVVLLLASAAFACGTWRGKFTVTAGGGSTTGIGINGTHTSGNGMQYCGGGQSNYSETGGGAQISSLTSTGAMTVTVEPASTCQVSGSNKLAAGPYTINFVNGRWHVAFGVPPVQDCMNGALVGGGGAGTEGVGVPVGTIQVNSNGYSLDSSGNPGSRTYSLAGLADSANDDSRVCISDALGVNNNMVPVTFI